MGDGGGGVVAAEKRSHGGLWDGDGDDGSASTMTMLADPPWGVTDLRNTAVMGAAAAVVDLVLRGISRVWGMVVATEKRSHGFGGWQRRIGKYDGDVGGSAVGGDG